MRYRVIIHSKIHFPDLKLIKHRNNNDNEILFSFVWWIEAAVFIHIPLMVVGNSLVNRTKAHTHLNLRTKKKRICYCSHIMWYNFSLFNNFIHDARCQWIIKLKLRVFLQFSEWTWLNEEKKNGKNNNGSDNLQHLFYFYDLDRCHQTINLENVSRFFFLLYYTLFL